MALVPWTCNNPRLERNLTGYQKFSFGETDIEIYQDTEIEINLQKNTGFKLWDGAYLLGKYLSSKYFPKDYFKGQKVVELGAGCGLVGMVMCSLGSDVTLTDLEDTLKHTKDSVFQNKDNINKNGGKVNVTPLMWGDKPACQKLGTFDFIVGSDIIYQKEYARDLLHTIKLLSHENTKIYISYKARGLGEALFFEMLSSYDLHCITVPKDHHPVEFANSDYDIMCLSLMQ